MSQPGALAFGGRTASRMKEAEDTFGPAVAVGTRQAGTRPEGEGFRQAGTPVVEDTRQVDTRQLGTLPAGTSVAAGTRQALVGTGQVGTRQAVAVGTLQMAKGSRIREARSI